MAKRFVSELQEGERVKDHFLVHSKQLLTTREGRLYIALDLRDKSGAIRARVWEHVEECSNRFAADDFIKVDSLVESYRGELQLNIRRLRKSEDSEVSPSDFLPSTGADVESMMEELRGYVEEIQNGHLKSLLLSFFDDAKFAAAFKRSAAARSIHHPFLGGLLEHTLSVVKLCRFLCEHYPDLDADLLQTLAVLHDVGKVEELSSAPRIDYTDEGHLLGHISIGLGMVQERIKDIPGFPAEMRMMVEHMIISHHGRHEWGSSVLPRFLEAEVLHRADDLDAKVNIFRRAILEDKSPDSRWTGYNPVLQRALYKRKASPNTGDDDLS